MIGSIISFVIALAIILIIAKVILKGSLSVLAVIINAAVGAVALWILNIIGLHIPITWLTAGIVGLLGVPGVVILCVAQYVFNIF